MQSSGEASLAALNVITVAAAASPSPVTSKNGYLTSPTNNSTNPASGKYCRAIRLAPSGIRRECSSLLLKPAFLLPVGCPMVKGGTDAKSVGAFLKHKPQKIPSLQRLMRIVRNGYWTAVLGQSSPLKSKRSYHELLSVGITVYSSLSINLLPSWFSVFILFLTRWGTKTIRQLS